MKDIYPKTAFIFPGQGELEPGIGKDIYEHSGAAQGVFDSEETLRDMCFEGSREVLNNPYNNQAANYLAWMAISAALREVEVHPDMLAGLSLGEYGALTLANSFSVGEGVSMLRERAKIMTDAIPQHSGMYAIFGLEGVEVLRHCEVSSQIDEPCGVAIYGTSDRTIITGSKNTIRDCAKRCVGVGAKAVSVKVARAFHSVLGESAREQFGVALQKYDIYEPTVPVYYNYDGTCNALNLRQMLADQIVNPVQLVVVIENLLHDGCRRFVRIGPGDFFGSCVEEVARSRRVDVEICSVETFDDIRSIVEQSEGVYVDA